MHICVSVYLYADLSLIFMLQHIMQSTNHYMIMVMLLLTEANFTSSQKTAYRHLPYQSPLWYQLFSFIGSTKLILRNVSILYIFLLLISHMVRLYIYKHVGIAQSVKNLPAVQETPVQSWVGKIPWRRKWQAIPISLPGKSHGQRSLVGYSPWGRKESGTTELLTTPG